MTLRITLWTLLCILGVAVAQIPAAQPEPTTLTLSDAIGSALENNPQVVAARRGVEAAAAQVTTARSSMLPQVYLSETFNYTNSPLWALGTKLNQGVIEGTDFNPDDLNDPDAVSNFNTALSVSWLVYDGGGSQIGWQQSKEMVQANRMDLLRTEQLVIAQAAKAYVGLLLALENEKVIIHSLETARAHLKLVEDRFRSGVAVKSDVLRAQVRIADLEQQQLMTHSQVQVAQAMLHATMGQSDGGALNPQTPFSRCIAPSASLQEWIDQALEQRPDLKKIQVQQSIAGKEIGRARSGRYPSVALQGNYEINSESFTDIHDNYSLGAVVRWNLYNGNRVSSQTAAAAASAAKVKAVAKQVEIGVRLETRRAYYTAQSTWESIAVARGAVDQAEEGLRIVGNRYGSGLLTIVDLLDAQVSLQQAHTRHFKALHDYKVARIELALAAGTIDRTFK